MSKLLVVIVGPTASGKSALAMRVAKRFNGEIICADSRTVYKEMDIGTAKPTSQEQREIPHHLLDIIEPNQSFSAAEFKQQALHAINDIQERDRLPVMVGGTGLYIDAILFDYQFGARADSALRKELNSKSLEELQNICRQKDIDLPVNQRNKRHLIRAIELGGLQSDARNLREGAIVVGITMNKEILHERIERRAQEMFRQGVLQEAEFLAKRYGWNSEAMTGNIYRVLRPVVEDAQSVEWAMENFIKSDMALAKRQMTWFKRNPHILWSDKTDYLLKKIEQFITQNHDSSTP